MKFSEYLKKTSKKHHLGQKSVRLGGYAALISVIAAAIAIFAVMSVDSLSARYTKFDMSKQALYSLSEESANIAKTVDRDVMIYMIAQSGTEDSITERLLEKYAAYSDNIKIEKKDPVVYPNFAKTYTDENISNNSLIVVSGDKSRYLAYNELYKTTVDYSSYSQTTEYDGENQITSAINYVVSESLPIMYLTTGHGESGLQRGMAEQVNGQNLETKELSMLTLSEIPEDADCILMNNPTSDISENEKNILLSYMKKGGKLILVTGYNGEDMPKLNELMRNYGVEGENKLILEGDPNMSVAGYNTYLVPNMASADITDPLINSKYAVLLPMAHIIRTSDEYDGNAMVTEILTTSSRAYAKEAGESMSTVEKTAQDEEGEFTIGVAVSEETDNGEAKLLWVSSAQLLDDNVNQLVSGGNGDLFLNAVNWMCEREESIAIHAKSLENEMLTVPSGAITLWSFVFIFFIPAVFIVIGIYVKLKRKKN